MNPWNKLATNMNHNPTEKHACLHCSQNKKQKVRFLSSFLAHLFPVAHLTFRGGEGSGEKEERKNLALRWSVGKKKLPTKELGCFFTFLLLSRISLPLDLHPTSAWNISECWVSLQAEKRCSLNKAIPCPLTGTCRYASPDLFFSVA